MKQHYLETRGRVHGQSASAVADIMRHWHARQAVGKAVVVCAEPAAMLALARKHWLKLSRDLQNRRNQTAASDQILRLTYLITRMQHQSFVADLPHERPEADVYFVRAQRQLGPLPSDCLSLYLASPVDSSVLGRLVPALAPQALVVDYCSSLKPGDFGLHRKVELEANVRAAWVKIERYFKLLGIDLLALVNHDIGALDNALDALCDDEAEFLQLAGQFQKTLNLARPLLTISKIQREYYDILARLAYQLDSLSHPSIMPEQFLSTSTDESFFMHYRRPAAEPLADVIARHLQAGRWRLARRLMDRPRPARSPWAIPRPAATTSSLA
jgi:hypothetical protein